VHHGFTLADLVSYDVKHNEANGEGNRDGSDDNRSWNCGVEGPTDDPAVVALRARQRRNLLATLLLSEGMPLLLGGDELGRTQGGNNNAYCQDNEISRVDWAAADAELIEFVARSVACVVSSRSCAATASSVLVTSSIGCGRTGARWTPATGATRTPARSPSRSPTARS